MLRRLLPKCMNRRELKPWRVKSKPGMCSHRREWCNNKWEVTLHTHRSVEKNDGLSKQSPVSIRCRPERSQDRHCLYFWRFVFKASAAPPVYVRDTGSRRITWTAGRLSWCRWLSHCTFTLVCWKWITATTQAYLLYAVTLLHPTSWACFQAAVTIAWCV